MRHYEMMIILDGELDERTVQPSLEKFLSVVTKDGGTVAVVVGAPDRSGDVGVVEDGDVRLLTDLTAPLRATGRVLPGDPPPALIEPRRPPLFRSVLRIDATADEIVLSCFAATGAGGPVLEDRVRARRDGRTWHW